MWTLSTVIIKLDRVESNTKKLILSALLKLYEVYKNNERKFIYAFTKESK